MITKSEIDSSPMLKKVFGQQVITRINNVKQQLGDSRLSDDEKKKIVIREFTNDRLQWASSKQLKRANDVLRDFGLPLLEVKTQ